ncbi:MAG: hypothetical protein OCD00_17985 [Colwellia sp.]
MLKPLFVKFIILLSVAMTVGCSSIGIIDLFSNYSQQMSKTRSAQLSGDFINAEAAVMSVNSSHNNYGLSQLEKGRLQFLANNWAISQKNFDLAYKQIQRQEQAAKVQISRGLQNIGAVVSNDNAIAYDIPAYEQGMLHTYQALNYLYQGGIESALVEVRRANLVQERALKTHQNELYEAQDKMVSKGISTAKLNASYPSMNSLIGDVKNGFQNAYTFYLSGMLYEVGKQPNDAYIDYKRAIEIYPNNTYLQQNVLRLAKKLGMHEDLTRFEQKFGKYKAKNKKNTGQVVVIFEQGIVNAKDEARLNLPIFNTSSDIKFFTFALPVYRGGVSTFIPLSVNVEGTNYYSQEIVKLQSLASKALKDQLPSLITRQAIRLIAKEQFRQELSRKNGDVGNFLASIYNIASENADTRSWSTLPNNVQIMKIDIAAGQRALEFTFAGKQHVVNINVKENRITLINFTDIGRYTGYQTISL